MATTTPTTTFRDTEKETSTGVWKETDAGKKKPGLYLTCRGERGLIAFQLPFNYPQCPALSNLDSGAISIIVTDFYYFPAVSHTSHYSFCS